MYTIYLPQSSKHQTKNKNALKSKLCPNRFMAYLSTMYIAQLELKHQTDKENRLKSNLLFVARILESNVKC